MRDKNRLKMNVEFLLDAGVVKAPSISVDRSMLLSKFIIEQYDIITSQLKLGIITFEVLTVEFSRIAVIDNKVLYMFVEDETIEYFKQDGIRKLKFMFENRGAKEFLDGEKEFMKCLKYHEDIIEEIN